MLKTHVVIPGPIAGDEWDALVERATRAYCVLQGLDPDAPRHDPDDPSQFTGSLWQQEAPLIEAVLWAAIREEPCDD